MRHEHRYVAHFLDDAVAIVSEYGAKAVTRIARGAPSTIIKEVATRIGAGAIVAAALGDAEREILVGEVRVPVLVIRESELSFQDSVARELRS
jgi:hypothetical protein